MCPKTYRKHHIWHFLRSGLCLVTTIIVVKTVAQILTVISAWHLTTKLTILNLLFKILVCSFVHSHPQIAMKGFAGPCTPLYWLDATSCSDNLHIAQPWVCNQTPAFQPTWDAQYYRSLSALFTPPYSTSSLHSAALAALQTVTHSSWSRNRPSPIATIYGQLRRTYPVLLHLSLWAAPWLDTATYGYFEVLPR